MPRVFGNGVLIGGFEHGKIITAGHWRKFRNGELYMFFRPNIG
jgi:hypothetical protein